MPDGEKIIDGLRHCMPETVIDGLLDCDTCPYQCDCKADASVSLPIRMVEDIRSLLKTQEAERLDFIGAVAELTAENVKLKAAYGDQGKIVGELVRCKDCRHCTFSDGKQLADCMIKQGWFPVKPDWFCADGERKEGRQSGNEKGA